VKANNEAYQAVQDYIGGYSVNADLQAAMRYYFRTGETKAFDAVKDLYDEYQKTEFDNFTKNAEFKKEGDFVAFVGKMTEADSEAIDEAWVNYLRTETEEEASEGLATWAIVLIVVGGVLVVAAAVLVPLYIAMAKKKEAQRIADETVNAYKRPKIDTTDDKSIDVYADETEEVVEEAEEATEENTEEETTEETEEVEEAPVEETVEEAPVEEVAPAPVEEVPAPVEEATDNQEE
jgi:outer membrane biosynthesis protein TonB